MMIGYLISAIVSYLFGSIPFGLLITQAAGLGDVRKIGSGNIGATNVLRTGRRELAALTLLLDALKGLAAVLLARYFFPGDAMYIAGLPCSWATASRCGSGSKVAKASRPSSASCLELPGPWGSSFARSGSSSRSLEGCPRFPH